MPASDEQHPDDTTLNIVQTLKRSYEKKKKSAKVQVEGSLNVFATVM